MSRLSAGHGAWLEACGRTADAEALLTRCLADLDALEADGSPEPHTGHSRARVERVRGMVAACRAAEQDAYADAVGDLRDERAPDPEPLPPLEPLARPFPVRPRAVTLLTAWAPPPFVVGRPESFVAVDAT